MRICIYGAGAIGGMMGSLLKKNGNEVVLIARGKHYQNIKEKGLRFISEEYDLDILQKFDVYDSVDTLGTFDLVINGLKAHSSSLAAENVGKLLNKNSILVPTLNGVPWWFFFNIGGKFNNYKIDSVDDGQKQWLHIGPSKVIGCVVYPAAEITEPGVIKHVEGKRFILGEPDNSRSDRIIKLSKLFYEAGIKAPISQDIRSDIWLKLIGNSSFNPLSVITKSTLIEMCIDQSSKEIIEEIMREVSLIGEKLDIKMKLDIEKRIEGAKNVGHHKTSTLQDFENDKPLEIDALSKALIELGQLTKVETPTIKIIYQLIKHLTDKKSKN